MHMINKKNEAPLLALSSGDNSVKPLCFGSFGGGGYHYTFIYVFLHLSALDNLLSSFNF